MRFPDGVTEKYRRQANYEVGVIIKMGYPGYFLVTADLIQHAKSVGIRCGPGRGSAAACWSPTSSASPTSTRSGTS